MDVLARVASGGRMTLPKSVRDSLRLKDGDRVLFRVSEDSVVVERVADFLEFAGSVSVPADKKRAAWSDVKAKTWRLRDAAKM